MFTFPKTMMKMLFLGLVLLSGGASLAPPPPLPAQQMQGQAALDFLAHTGILSQIEADTPPQGRTFLEPTPHNATDFAAGDLLGISVAVSEDTLIVGAYRANMGGNTNQGAAYVFTRSGANWSQQQKLVAADGAAFDEFGISVAVSENTLIVGAHQANLGGNNSQGAAYVFTRSGANWSQQQKLVAADGVGADYFGRSVALDGETALVGAHRATVGGNTDQGSAYVFTRSGTSWSLQRKLVAADGADSDRFGHSVALDGETALLGTYGDNTNQGAVYVFTRSGANWSQQQKLVAADGSVHEHFGRSVALNGETALVGAHLAYIGGNTNQGAAYVFTRSGTSWSQQQKLVAADGAATDLFGSSVALDGETALIGARADVGANGNQGAAYVFTRSGASWSEQQKLVVRDGAAGDWFGRSVALDGDTALVGADRANVGGLTDTGKFYMTTRGPTPWPETGSNVANDGAAGDGFGVSAALDGETVLVGASQADVGDNIRQGAAYVFTRNGPIWVMQQKLVAADGAASDSFGTSVALDGETALVGAHVASVGGNFNQGAAYVFTRSGTSWSQQQKLVAADGATNDWFGYSVVLAGGTALVGAVRADVGSNTWQGAAYVFTHSGANWSQQQKLVAADGAASDWFGRSVALDGETALVGAYQGDVGGNFNQGGAAYVFTRSGTSWSQQQKLVAADGASTDLFGRSVALAGETALVGAGGADVGGNTSQGAAYVFTRSGANWSQQQKLVAADGAAGDEFGSSVALAGDTALVGAFWADIDGLTDTGKFYTTTRGPVPWPQTGSNVANDGAAGARFGVSVALDGETALVGAYHASISGNTIQGAAYVFTRNGPIWVQQQKLVAADGAAGDQFGISVALDGETALVGAHQADVGGNTWQGAAYVFTRSGTSWSQQQKLLATDGAAGDRLGISVALDGETALVGADRVNVGGNIWQGAAYVFTRSGTSWSQQQKLVAVDGAANDQFGISVALDGQTALVGAYRATVGSNSDQGAAYVFTRSGTNWSQQQKLVAADGAAQDFFGYSVALDGETALVGAYLADVGTNTNQGAAYVFRRSGTNWSQQQKLVTADGAAQDFFGISVALEGETALVGASRANMGGNETQGTAYVFTRSGTSWSHQQKLVAVDGAAGEQFGSVALDGETALVGAVQANVGGNNNQGKVYFFERQGLVQLWLPLVVRNE